MRVAVFVDQSDVPIAVLDALDLNALPRNLLELRVHRYKDVNIQVVHKETQEVQCSFDISFEELLEEIEENYKKYIRDIREINNKLIKSKTVRMSVKYYDILTELLEK